MKKNFLKSIATAAKSVAVPMAAVALTMAFTACSESDPAKTAGGTSEEAEGIIAITNKTIAGVSQKGPFVTGSNVILKETDRETLTPTGQEFFATIRNNEGEFKISNISLKSQYALLNAQGYYTRESTKKLSECQISLNATSDISNRENTNINLLTHFEYQRVINLVKSGMSFGEAKKQAFSEVMEAFGFQSTSGLPEDLDITSTSYADTALLAISYMIDLNNNESKNQVDNMAMCKETQDYIDAFADDFADDGILSDSIAYHLTSNALSIAMRQYTTSGNHVDWYDILTIDPYLDAIIGKFFDVGPCTKDKQGVYTNFDKYFKSKTSKKKEEYPFADPKENYVLVCNNERWIPLSQNDFVTFTKEFPHEVGSITDSRDGKTYKTTKFTYEGTTYEWMSENLRYGLEDSLIVDSIGPVYSWAKAMGFDDSLMPQPIDTSLIGVPHQGICPDNWHIATSKEWAAIVDYVGKPHYLVSTNWIPRGLASIADGYGNRSTFFDNLDFSVESTYSDGIYGQDYIATYITYSRNPDYLKEPVIESYDSAELCGWDYFKEKFDCSDFSTITFLSDAAPALKTYRPEQGYVRCVKD